MTVAKSIVLPRAPNQCAALAYGKPADAINEANAAVPTMLTVWSDIAPS